MKRKQWLLMGFLVVGSFASCLSANTLANEAADTSKLGQEVQAAEVPVAEANWIYYIEEDTSKLMRLDKSTSKKEGILTNVSCYRICGDKLFFAPSIDWDVPNAEGVNAYIGSLYVSDLEGKNPQLIAGKDKLVMPVNQLKAGDYITYVPLSVDGNWLYFATAYGIMGADGCSYSMYRYHLNDKNTELLSQPYMSLNQYYIGHDKMIFISMSPDYNLGAMIKIDLTTKKERFLSYESCFLGSTNDKLYYFTSDSRSTPSNASYKMGLLELDPATNKHTELANNIQWDGYKSQGLLKNDLIYCITPLDDNRATVFTYNLTTKEKHEEVMDNKEVQEEIIAPTTFQVGQKTYALLPAEDSYYGQDVFEILKDGSKRQVLHNVINVEWITDTK